MNIKKYTEDTVDMSFKLNKRDLLRDALVKEEPRFAAASFWTESYNGIGVELSMDFEDVDAIVDAARRVNVPGVGYSFYYTKEKDQTKDQTEVGMVFYILYPVHVSPHSSAYAYNPGCLLHEYSLEDVASRGANNKTVSVRLPVLKMHKHDVSRPTGSKEIVYKVNHNTITEEVAAVSSVWTSRSVRFNRAEAIHALLFSLDETIRFKAGFPAEQVDEDEMASLAERKKVYMNELINGTL